jgi:general secretion pathway protein K
VALLAVLGFLAVMSLLAIGVVGAARTAATGASRELLRAQAQVAVESGIDFAVAELVNGAGFAPAFVTAPQTIEVGGFRVRISARPEHAKVDLNYADANLLAVLFRAGGADRTRAAALASAVEDWRDGDDLVRVNGAERRQYQDAGRTNAPANKRFGTTAELKRVLGVTGPLYDCIRPEVTVLSQRQGIDLDFAAPALRQAAGLEPSVKREEPPAIDAGGVFEITARLVDDERRVRRAERAVVRITGNPSDPYWILSVEAVHPLEDAAARHCPKTVTSAAR